MKSIRYMIGMIVICVYGIGEKPKIPGHLDAGCHEVMEEVSETRKV